MTGHTTCSRRSTSSTETSVPVAGGTAGCSAIRDDYDRDYCVDLVQLRGVRRGDAARSCRGARARPHDGPDAPRFLARLQGEIAKRGVIDVLRNGVKHGPHHVDLFYGTPSPGNAKADERFAATASASRASCATAATRRSSPSTCACSSTACRSPRSS